MSNITYLDLDEIRSGFDFTVKIGGREIKVKPITVEDFLEEANLIEKLGVGASAKDEVEVSISILSRALPEVSEKELRDLNFRQISALRDFVMKANAQIAQEGGEGDTEGNAEKVS